MVGIRAEISKIELSIDAKNVCFVSKKIKNKFAQADISKFNNSKSNSATFYKCNLITSHHQVALA